MTFRELARQNDLPENYFHTMKSMSPKKFYKIFPDGKADVNRLNKYNKSIRNKIDTLSELLYFNAVKKITKNVLEDLGYLPNTKNKSMLVNKFSESLYNYRDEVIRIRIELIEKVEAVYSELERKNYVGSEK